MNKLKGKKLLILGGKPLGSYEIVEYAKKQGIYTIVTDYLSPDHSPAKQIADEVWDISTSEVQVLSKRVIEKNIDGIYTGVHEFNIARMIEICAATHRPCFCTKNQWDYLLDKRNFKQLCRENDIPVAKEYKIEWNDDSIIDSITFPVIIKPADGSGSRGFAICRNVEDLKSSYDKAVKFSKSGAVLVEQFMNYENSVIINYTILNGKVIYSGMSDKRSKKVLDNGAPVMALQFYPSQYESIYLDELDAKVKRMYANFGLQNGVLWIEAFCDRGKFTFNEMGYRFGGSLTYYPVKKKYGINQLELQIEYALTGDYSLGVDSGQKSDDDKIYTIFPVHVKPGIITEIKGLDIIRSWPESVQFVFVHSVGDVIQSWGTAQQVLAYIHFESSTREKSAEFADMILHTLSVKDEKGQEMLFNLYR